MTLQLTKPKPPAVVLRSSCETVRRPRSRRHWLWVLAGFPFAFAVPFVFADLLDLNRDLFYGLYALAVAVLRRGLGPGHPPHPADLSRNWRWGLALGALGAAAMTP